MYTFWSETMCFDTAAGEPARQTNRSARNLHSAFIVVYLHVYGVIPENITEFT